MCPGATKTDMMDVVRSTLFKQDPYEARMATTQEIAGAAAFLASEDAGFITGVTILSVEAFTAI